MLRGAVIITISINIRDPLAKQVTYTLLTFFTHKYMFGNYYQYQGHNCQTNGLEQIPAKENFLCTLFLGL